MAFTGKCTYTAGTTIPEVAEDVGDLVSILSPHETPLLDALGDPLHAATSTRHEWLDDELLPNFDNISQPGLNDSGLNTASVTVANGGRFRVGDQVQGEAKHEVMFVSAVAGNTLTLVRGYGGSTKQALVDGLKLRILGNAALEGADADAARFTVRTRRSNYTQIFSAAVQVSGTEAAVRQIAVDDEMDYQKTNRLRELLRDLENTAINGVAPSSNPQGSATVRRTMQGIIGNLATNVLAPGATYVPLDADLSEGHINGALRTIWEISGNKPDLIVCGGGQKRRINAFIQTNQRFAPDSEVFKNTVSTYESDFGVCRVVLSRYVPADTVLFLDSSRISVLPLAGRSFQFKPLASTGDYESGEVLGEYTVELRNEKGHGVLSGLTV
ncbi:MAG TPA: DUF5309 family protein [Phycisphaerae bacterium]|nr:DUF5309 family protein [Phycisphaerae bacterium]